MFSPLRLPPEHKQAAWHVFSLAPATRTQASSLAHAADKLSTHTTETKDLEEAKTGIK
jgi:hypothetical protein